MVNIALEIEPVASCLAGDINGDGHVFVDEIITGVNNLLDGCPAEATPTPTEADTPSETPTATPMITSTQEPSAPPTLAPTAEATSTPSPTATEGTILSVADAVARDADGVAVRLGQTVTIEGVVTVSAGIFANNKLKVFA